MNNLCLVIIGTARFLELSSDEVIDPDAAVAAMEDMSAILQTATLPEKQAFITACQTEAIRLQAVGDLQLSKFVGELPTAMALSAEP